MVGGDNSLNLSRSDPIVTTVNFSLAVRKFGRVRWNKSRTRVPFLGQIGHFQVANAEQLLYHFVPRNGDYNRDQ